MTEGEYLIMQRDRQTRMTIRKSRRKDSSGARMHLNMAKGLQMKLERMSGEELETEHE